jgi:hypothetical protein
MREERQSGEGARAGPRRGRKERERERGKDGPSVAHVGRGEERGPEGEGEGVWAAVLFSFLLLFFFFSTLKLFKQYYLNSNLIHPTQLKQCSNMNAQTS